MVQVEFYVPTRRHRSGRLHPSTAFRKLHRFLDELGGWTIHGRVQGAWKNPKTRRMVREESFHYSVAVSRRSLRRLCSFLAADAKILFDQQAIYFKGPSGKVEFL